MCRQCIDEMAVRDLEEFDLSDFLERFDEALDDLPLEVSEMIEEDPEKASDFELLREMTFKYSLEEYFEENTNMEEVSHSPYFMQKFDKTIQNLSPELRRKVYKDYVAMMQREREEKGWKEVHEVLLQAAKDPSTPCKKCMRPFEGCTFCREVSRLKWNGLLKTSNYYDEMID